ncbi:MAG: glycosyltransferase [Burkholderiales bacterium]|nr:hypothetical protein [Nitrosomonas sp.]MCP5274533.1 glycosyltransferase [Burkholderiales bacterium]
MKRILIYSHDTFGLGNIRRMLSIAKHLVSEHKDYSVLLLSGSPMLHAFRIPQQLDYIKLPCLQRDELGMYGVRSLGIDMTDTLKLRSNLIRSTVEDYQPDIVMIDKKPLGICAELEPALDYLKKRRNPPGVILLLRDILDSPEVTRKIWQKRGYFDAIENYYDRILVVGQPEIFDIASEYDFPSAAAEKIEYCGYIRRESGLKNREEILTELGLNDRQKLLLITPGGGKDGTHLVTNYLKAIKTVSSQHFHSLVLCGPEMMEACQELVNTQARGCNGITIRNFTDDLMSYMNAADGVISMFGYNTMCEILTLQKPAIVIPRVRPVKEQWIRAMRMTEMGIVKAIHPDQLNTKNLKRAVNALLSKQYSVPSGKTIKLDGLPNIKRFITAYMQEISQRKSIRVKSCTTAQGLHQADLSEQTESMAEVAIEHFSRD